MRLAATLALFVALFVDPLALRNPWPRCVPPNLASVPLDSIVTAGDTIRFSAGLWRNDMPMIVPAGACGGGDDRHIHLYGRLQAAAGSSPGFARPDTCVVVRARDAWRSAVAWDPERRLVVLSARTVAPPVALGDSVAVLVRFLDRAGNARWIAARARVSSAE